MKESHSFASVNAALVVFSSPNCPPCPPTKKKAQERCDKAGVRCYEINAERHMALANDSGVFSLPTTVVVRNGEIIDGNVGQLTDEQVDALIEELQ